MPHRRDGEAAGQRSRWPFFSNLLIGKMRHHTTRVQIVAGPNELRVPHFFPHIIRFFTLFRRRRCTPNEYST